MNLERFLEKKIRSKADKLDINRRSLYRALRKLGRKKQLAVRVSPDYGGTGLAGRDYFEFTELLQSYSGAFGFLQRQHQAAARFIFEGGNDVLKGEWLPLMAKGKRLVGVSVSHLRDPQHPRVIAERAEDGWSLSGSVSWVSGYRLLDHLVVGFVSPEKNEEGMALIPFKRGRGLKFSKPFNTVALSSIQTVQMELKGYTVEEKSLFALKPVGSYQEASSVRAVHFVNLSALVRAFQRLMDKKGVASHLPLSDAYAECREAFLNRSSDDELLELYARMHAIATRFCYLTRLSYKAAALICPNPVERLYRELMLFGVIISDDETLDACLEQLLS